MQDTPPPDEPVRRSFLGRAAHSYSVLGIRNFRFLFLSNICINLAQWFQLIGLGWLVLQLTGSAAQMGAITATQGVALLITSPLAGVLSDRLPRRTLLMTTTTITAVQARSRAPIVASGHGELWQLYVFAAVGGAANSVTQPVRQAFVYDAVGRESVARAVPINNLAQSGTRALGPVLAGVVIGFIGSHAAFYTQGVLALLAMILTSRIGVTQQVRTSGASESPFETLTKGLRYVAGTRALREQVLLQFVPVVLLYPYVQFLAFFAVYFNGGPQAYGVLSTGAGYGGILALIILTTMGEVRRKGLVLLVAVCAYPISVALFSLSPNIAVAMVFLVINGFCNQIYMTMQSTLFLLSAREDMRGRVMGIYSMINGLGLVGQLGLGFAISVWGPPRAVLAFALTAAVALLFLALTSRTVRAA